MEQIGTMQTPYGLADVIRATYLSADGPPAVVLFHAETGASLGTLSVNLVDEELGDGEFFVKTWSENEALIEPALASGLFEDTGRRIMTGHADSCEAQVWRFMGGGSGG